MIYLALFIAFSILVTIAVLTAASIFLGNHRSTP